MKAKRVWFYRHWRAKFGGSNGGNLKVRDAFNFVDQSEDLEALLCIDQNTIWNDFPGNHWLDLRHRARPHIVLQEGDVLFFSGKDWVSLNNDERYNPPVPVVNIVQPRHAREEDPRNAFLKHPAIRIAKSEHGASILRDYGVKGPVFVVPDAIDLGLIPEIRKKDIDILILGLKDPELASEVYMGLLDWARENGLVIKLQLPPKLPTRTDFLELLGRARIAVCIPLPMSKGGEGFYLPPLEAMASQSLVVTSLAVGNVDHCTDGHNCFVAQGDAGSFIKMIRTCYGCSEEFKAGLIENGLKTASRHSITEERNSILNIVREAYSIWKDIY